MSAVSHYDPFQRGPHPFDQRTIELRDDGRGRLFRCELWIPATPETRPLIVFSHPAAQGRRSASYLCTHLAGHGFFVAALDHSEVVAPELARPQNETEEQKTRRWQAIIDSRVPDVRFLLDQLLGSDEWQIDPDRIGLAGHSFGGWTVLAVPDRDRRVRSIVALAPAGASQRRPGILPVTLDFAWGRDVPTLYLVAENDTSIPLPGMFEIFERTPGTKRMIILRRADHLHFMDNFEQLHETFRTAPPLSAELAAIQKEMRPIAELHSEEQAQRFVRGLSLAHFDATLRGSSEAQRFLASDLGAMLAQMGIEAIVHQ